jgi:hypothetical protein
MQKRGGLEFQQGFEDIYEQSKSIQTGNVVTHNQKFTILTLESVPY